MPTKDEVLAYALAVKRQRPHVTDEELRAVLKARFIDGKDPLAEHALRVTIVGAVGIVTNPLDWIIGLSKILHGIGKLWGNHDVSGVMDMIEGVIIIVQEPMAAQA